MHPTTYTAHALMSVGCSAEGEQAGAALAAIPTNYLLVKPQLEKGHLQNAPKRIIVFSRLSTRVLSSGGGGGGGGGGEASPPKAPASPPPKKIL